MSTEKYIENIFFSLFLVTGPFRAQVILRINTYKYLKNLKGYINV
tara:strand:+ start:337 stop:471 length:135 start_codon:yes stop_codon:yes gene_type:complete